MEKSIGLLIEEYIKNTIAKILSNKKIPDIEYIATDNLGEIIEKLAILHIRIWMLEDLIHSTMSDKKLADLKRKIDICFKIKRPKLVQAINLLIEHAIITNKSLIEDSVKIYNGVDE